MLTNTAHQPEAAAATFEPIPSRTPSVQVPASRKLWRQTFALDNVRGETEAFSIGPDQSVWHFYPEARTQGGYQLECLHMAAEAVAACLAPDGRMYVFACRGMSVTYVVESRDGKRWSTPMRAALPAAGEGYKIVRIQADATPQGILLTVFADLEKHIGRTDHSSTEVAMSFTLWTQGATPSRPMASPQFDDSASKYTEARTQVADFRYTASVPINQH